MITYQSELKNYTYVKKNFEIINLVPELDDFEKSVLKTKIEGKLFEIFSSYISGEE